MSLGVISCYYVSLSVILMVLCDINRYWMSLYVIMCY